MNKFTLATLAATGIAFAGEAIAVEWNVSLWGKRRAFTEHVEKLAELVSAKTGGAFTLNISYGGLSKNKENLDGISIGAFEMAQFCAGYHARQEPLDHGAGAAVPRRDSQPGAGDRGLDGGLQRTRRTRKDLGALERYPADALAAARSTTSIGVGDAPEPPWPTSRASRCARPAESAAAMKAVGAVPTSMSATEVRQALDSGVVKARELSRRTPTWPSAPSRTGQVVDHQPQSRHRELPCGGEHRRPRGPLGRRLPRGIADLDRSMSRARPLPRQLRQQD